MAKNPRAELAFEISGGQNSKSGDQEWTLPPTDVNPPMYIAFSEKDSDRNRPPVYAPMIINSEDYALTENQVRDAWRAFQEKLKKEEDSRLGLDDQLEYRQSLKRKAAYLAKKDPSEVSERGWNENQVVYIEASPESSDPVDLPEYTTAPLSLIRYGRQIVRVYAPEVYKVYERVPKPEGDGVWRLKRYSNKATMDLMLLPQVDLDVVKNEEELFGRDALDTDSEGLLADSLFSFKGQGDRTGRFFQQSPSPDGGAYPRAQYTLRMTFGNQEFTKNYVYEANSGRFAQKQVINNGRKIELITETLVFNGDTEVTVSHAWAGTRIHVLGWSEFRDQNTQVVKKEHRPRNIKPDQMYDGGKASVGTFYAKGPQWGTILVQYEVPYTEFEVIYDYPNPALSFEVVPGQVEMAGFVEYVGENLISNWGIDANDNGFVKYPDGDAEASDTRILLLDRDDADNVVLRPMLPFVDQLEDWNNPTGVTSTDLDADKKIGFKICKKIRYLPMKVPPITFLATDGGQIKDLTWQPPAPVIEDVGEEVPKVVLFEKRSVSAQISLVDEVTYLTCLGQVQNERFKNALDPSG